LIERQKQAKWKFFETCSQKFYPKSWWNGARDCCLTENCTSWCILFIRLEAIEKKVTLNFESQVYEMTKGTVLDLGILESSPPTPPTSPFKISPEPLYSPLTFNPEMFFDAYDELSCEELQALVVRWLGRIK
jgi:hypothetical protein